MTDAVKRLLLLAPSRGEFSGIRPCGRGEVESPVGIDGVFCSATPAGSRLMLLT